MPVHNSEVARIFEEYADLLEINGANEYRVRAYRTAARNISYLGQNLADMVRRGEELSSLPGIGEDLAGKIKEIVQTGHLSQLENLKKTIPEDLVSITHIAGLGPRRAYRLYYGLGIASIQELEQAAREGKIRSLRGFGIKSEQAILADIERRGEAREGRKIKLSAAEETVEPLQAYLAESRGVRRVEVAGSYRRGVEIIGDLDILATAEQSPAEQGSDVIDRLIHYDHVERVIASGPTRSTVILRNGLQVDLRVVSDESYGAALHYFTGARPHTLAVRKMASRRRLKINEYGVFKGEQFIAGRIEEEVYAQVGLPYIEPELRENRGEIEAAKAGKLPNLIKPENIRGDLHTHTRASDGYSSLEEMARAAQARGYEYLAITEHSRRLTIAHGLDSRRLTGQIAEIDDMNSRFDRMRLLKGLEVDILEDGSLDMPAEILEKLDLVVCSVHSHFNLSREKQTDRIIRAMQHPYFLILGHPTGRLIDERGPYDLDMEKMLKAAREYGCIMELNAQPDRLDLDDIYCKMAKDMGVMIAIGSDAHSTFELDFMRFGVIQARRGWLEAGNVLNTRSWRELQRILDRYHKVKPGAKALKPRIQV